MRRQIRVALEHLRRRDLYDVLGLTRDAPTAEIIARADAERQRWMHKSQVTAEKTAWLEAVSYAQSHLTTPAARARYDRTLALEAEEELTRAIQFALKGLSRLDPGTRQVLLDEAAALGIGPERAGVLLRRASRAAGVVLDGGAPEPVANGPARWLRCRSCSGVTDFLQAARTQETATCRHCGVSLHWSCPVCRRKHWVDEPRCPCGFLLEHLEPLVRHFEAAQHAHKVRDFAAALEHLRRVQEFAPHHVGARKGVQKIKEHLAQIEQVRATFESELARHHLVAAGVAVATWARWVDPTLPELQAARARVAQGLRDARALAAKAQARATADPKEARRLFRQALAIAAD
ncbi:MAG: hypothetical protein IRY99_27945, partial [Isosphaeraceae bacterium]|nr:hypothetical protein [Isosphaeraceae bacterium]